MKIIKIPKKDWKAGLERSKKSFRVYGPIQGNNKEHSYFGELEQGVEPDMSIERTGLSPKAIVFPRSEVMFEYTTDTAQEGCNIMQPPEKNYSPLAVVGIRPYDVAAMLLVKKNFDTSDYRDPYWCDAFDACTFIGLAVNQPDSLDFSTSTKTGPFDTKGLDILLVDLDEYYLAQVLSTKGTTYLEAAGFNQEAEADAEKQIEAMQKSAEDGIKSQVDFEKIKSKTIMELYEADFWEDAAFACINCGTCTYVCPTCWCFDIQDEKCGKQGKRFKNWDSCMFPLFTVHTTGHNPRAAKVQRVRQRFMHKLKYFMDKYDDGIMCVGCGRCIQACPVNLDIRSICEKMNA